MKFHTKTLIDEAVASLAVLLTVVLYFGAIALLVSGCAGTFAPRAPRPPRGKYSLEQAQRWAQKNRTPRVQNRGYYQLKPR